MDEGRLAELLQPLKRDWAQVESTLSEFIRTQLEATGLPNLVLGLSGGLDSAVSCALAIRAVGAEHIFPYSLPATAFCTDSSPEAIKVAKHLGVLATTVDISPMVKAYPDPEPSMDELRRGNLMARLRMMVLYDRSKAHRAVVMGTSNKSELIMGYGTLFGDLACAFNPLGGLYKTQIRWLAEHLGLPGWLIKKTPSAGLWEGQTDEEEMGITYPMLDAFAYRTFDLMLGRDEILALGFPEDKCRLVVRNFLANQFKRALPPIAHLSGWRLGEVPPNLKEWL